MKGVICLNTHPYKKILALLSSAALLASLFCLPALADDTARTPVSYKFDFGETPEAGYISVSATKAYSKKDGYGFHTPEFVKNVPASGEGALSDAVEFTKFGTDSDNTFDVDLPPGRYKIKVTAGDIARMSVAAEGYFAIMNMTGNNCYSEVELPVTDGQLNILATEGKANTVFNISTLEITQMEEDEIKPHTLFVGGDSTVTTYYPLDVRNPEPTVQGGWGQMLKHFVPEDYYVQNYATGGQFAKGFLTSGQFDAVEHYIQPGDIFLVEFGINDSNYSNEEEFKASMLEMVQRVKAKGATPVVVVPQGRAGDFGETDLHYKPDRWYKQSAKSVADAEQIPYIDLHNISSAYFTQIGQEQTTSLYWINWDGKQDTLHPNRAGAGILAKLLVEEMQNQKLFGQSQPRVLPYRYSDDLLTKITAFPSSSEDATSVSIQNQTADELPLTIFAVAYHKDTKQIMAIDSQQITLTPFDPFMPEHTDTLHIPPMPIPDCYIKLYIYDGYELSDMIASDDSTAEFALPSKIASDYFDNYVAPVPVPTPSAVPAQ
jgi:lysophospholipase L1-like esterase